MLKSMPTVKRTTRRRVAAEVLTLGLIATFIVPMATFAGKGGGSAVTPWIGLDKACSRQFRRTAHWGSAPGQLGDLFDRGAKEHEQPQDRGALLKTATHLPGGREDRGDVPARGWWLGLEGCRWPGQLPRQSVLLQLEGEHAERDGSREHVVRRRERDASTPIHEETGPRAGLFVSASGRAGHAATSRSRLPDRPPAAGGSRATRRASRVHPRQSQRRGSDRIRSP